MASGEKSQISYKASRSFMQSHSNENGKDVMRGPWTRGQCFGLPINVACMQTPRFQGRRKDQKTLKTMWETLLFHCTIIVLSDL